VTVWARPEPVHVKSKAARDREIERKVLPSER